MRLAHAHVHLLKQPAAQGPEGRFQQAILVIEVMRHQSRRDIRAAGDLCQSAADVAHFRQAVDGDLDQLDAPEILQLNR